MGQNKLYKEGQTKSKEMGGGTVKAGTQQGRASKTQGGQHEGKNRAVNHGRSK